MAHVSQQPQHTVLTVPTIDTALVAASRLLNAAEMETNLALMERLEKLADSWVSIAGLLVQREHNA
jgi:hypothetical protein